MKVFVTGATGFIGIQLCKKLAETGQEVHALFRDPKKAAELEHPSIRLFKGDVLDRESMRRAMQGCRQIYHLAAFTGMWSRDPQMIYDLNVTATMNVLDLATELMIADVVISSTAGVLGPSSKSEITEMSQREVDYFVDYERTKAIAEEKALAYCQRGLNIRIVNPTRVFGPGVLNTSNSVTKLIASYMDGTWRLIPGNGKSIGNYAYVEDVVDGCLLAMRKGKSGERYILGGENISYNDFFRLLGEITGKKRMLVRVPLFIMLLIAGFSMTTTRMLGTRPLITSGLARKYHYNWQTSSQKAISGLGYSITPLPQALRITVEWLKNQ